MKNVAVEKGLSPIRDYLKDAGYRVYEVDSRQLDNKDFIDGFDAVVITGSGDNVMGIQKALSKTAVIEARGKTPDEVLSRLDQILKH